MTVTSWLQAVNPPPDKATPAGKAGVTESNAENNRQSNVDSVMLSQPEVKAYGATPDEWLHFAGVLGLAADLLPVVSNPHAPISPNSSMSQLGKAPSRYNGRREAVGIPEWTSHRATDAEIAAWRREPDYGICLITREVRAIDVDIEDSQLAAAVRDFITQRYTLPMRTRADSSKFLLVFKMPGEIVKRSVKTTGGIVEFLASGQQCIVAGTHPKGQRYTWPGGLPATIPTISTAEFEQLWQDLADKFAIEATTTTTTTTSSSSPTPRAQVLTAAAENDPIARALAQRGMVKKIEKDGRMHIDCPWQDAHTGESSISSTTYFPAHTGGFELGNFKCMHAHCEGHTRADLVAELGLDDATLDAFSALPDEPPGDDGQSLRYQLQPWGTFMQHQAKTVWFIHGVLPAAELAVMYGASGSGKSFMALDMAMAVARGEPWRGCKVKQGTVAYIAAEGANGMRKRLAAYAHQYHLDPDDVPIYVLDAAPDFLKQKDIADLIRGIKALGQVDLIIVDTLACVTAGANENSGEDMGLALAHCRVIHRHTGAMVELIHHSGKDADRGARGWSGLRAAADAEFEITCDFEQKKRQLRVSKQKDGEDGGEFGFRLLTVLLGHDEDGEDVTSCIVEHDDAVRVDRHRKKLGIWQKAAIRMVKDLTALFGENPQVGEVIDEIARIMPPPEEGKRDSRRDHALRAVDKLMLSGTLKSEGGRLLCE
jgi:hypothetical protein